MYIFPNHLAHPFLVILLSPLCHLSFPYIKTLRAFFVPPFYILRVPFLFARCSPLKTSVTFVLVGVELSLHLRLSSHCSSLNKLCLAPINKGLVIFLLWCYLTLLNGFLHLKTGDHYTPKSEINSNTVYVAVFGHGPIITHYVLAVVIVVAVLTARGGILTGEMMALHTLVLFGHSLNLAQKSPKNTGLCLVRHLNVNSRGSWGSLSHATFSELSWSGWLILLFLRETSSSTSSLTR